MHPHHPDKFRLITTAIGVIFLISCGSLEAFDWPQNFKHGLGSMRFHQGSAGEESHVELLTQEEKIEMKDHETHIQVVLAKIAKEAEEKPKTDKDSVFLEAVLDKIAKETATAEEPSESASMDDYVEPIYLTRLIRKYEEENRDTIMELEKEAEQMRKEKPSHMDFYGHIIPPLEVSEIKGHINDIRGKERIRSVVVDFIQRMTIEEWKYDKANRNKQAAI